MKIIVLAQTPPPVHGQSLMVRTLVEGLPARSSIEVFHVNLALSRDTRDIGAWRWGKVLSLLKAAFQVYRLRRQHGALPLYYVPAPAKRSALYRDWLAMLLCRPVGGKLILHWHAVGLGRWLETEANFLERRLTRFFLGGATLSLVLAPELAEDAAFLEAKQSFVLPNGIPDPGEPAPRGRREPGKPCELLYLALCSEEKGLFDLLEALAHVLARQPGSFRLTVAGAFASAGDEARFHEMAAPLRSAVRHVGFAGEAAKHALFEQADVFCFPTRYPHEAQPLVIMEALAHDLPIVATRWRAIPGMLPSGYTWVVEPARPAMLADALLQARASPRPGGASRRFFLENYTEAQHLDALAATFYTTQQA